MGKFLDYLRNSKKPLITLGCLLASVMGTVGLAHAVQTDFGKIKVESGSIETTLFDDTSAKVNIGYKLYTPAGLGAGEKAPAALCLHGYQNDHETSAAYAIELARRGYVALAIDEYGHGSTNAGMIDRGYTNHKVTTNYGWDEDGKTYLEIKGQTRYKVMMNFSNLDFSSTNIHLRMTLTKGQ